MGNSVQVVEDCPCRYCHCHYRNRQWVSKRKKLLGTGSSVTPMGCTLGGTGRGDPPGGQTPQGRGGGGEAERIGGGRAGGDRPQAGGIGGAGEGVLSGAPHSSFT